MVCLKVRLSQPGEQCDSGVFPATTREFAAQRVAGSSHVKHAGDGRVPPRALLADKQRLMIA